MESNRVSRLNAEFGTEAIRFEEGLSGPVVNVRCHEATARIALHGAHVLSWIPTGTAEVIFVSEQAVYREGTPLRGGVPVCWPWFCDHPDFPDAFAHGFARRSLWQFRSSTEDPDGRISLTFRLSGEANSFPFFSRPFELEFNVNVGKALRMSLTTQNPGDTPFVIRQALHTYLRVSDVRNVTLQGLEDLPYLDDTAGGVEKQQNGLLRVTSEVDRFFSNTDRECILRDEGERRNIHIQRTGSRSVVVWNPGAQKAAEMTDFGDNEYLRMICVEAVNAHDDTRIIAPDGTHTMTQTLCVEKW